MKISDKIDRYLEKKIRIINEQDVDTLGFFDCKNQIVCCYVGSEKYIRKIPQNAKTIIISEELEEKLRNSDKGLIIIDEPNKVFWDLHQKLYKDTDYVRTQFNSSISSKANISDYAVISPKNVVIEDNVIVEEFVTIYENAYIGRNSIIRSGCRIGGVGFQEYRFDNSITTINHYGGVYIGANVDIHNNSCIDRGLFPTDNTIIGDDTKIDSMVHIGHASRIGSGCEIVSNSVIAGRCVIGNNVWIGLGVTVSNFVCVGDNSRLSIGSVVVNDVPSNGNVSGYYAIEHNKFLFEQLQRYRI